MTKDSPRHSPQLPYRLLRHAVGLRVSSLSGAERDANAEQVGLQGRHPKFPVDVHGPHFASLPGGEHHAQQLRAKVMRGSRPRRLSVRVARRLRRAHEHVRASA